MRHEQRLEGRLHLLDGGLELLDLGGRFGGHFGVVNRNELARLHELVFLLLQPVGQFHQRRQAPVFASQFGQLFGVAERPGIGQRPLDLCGTRQLLGEAVAETQAFFPNFWRKRSTRPAVSTRRCLPV